MFNRRARSTTGVQVARQCWTLLTENKQWLSIPIFSAVGVAIVTVIFGIIGLVVFTLLSTTTENNQNSSSMMNMAGVILGLLYYFVAYTIINYSEVALVSVVLMKIGNHKTVPTAADGFAVANKRLGAILTFSALSATVGTIARMIGSGNSKNLVMFALSRLLAIIIQGTWMFMTLMVTPVIAVENLDALAAIGRSWSLFKQTWGEQVVGRFTLGLFGLLLTLAAMLPGLLVLGLGMALNSPAALIGGIAVLVLGIVIISLLTNAASGIFKAVLYHYATEGNTGGILDAATVSQVFVAR